MNKLILSIIISFLSTELYSQASIVDTKHNLSIYGSGDFKATAEEQVCIFCHASHRGDAQAPLWNRYEASTTYTLYGSPTMDTNTLQPGSKSRLCLSCHDGTVALGLVRSRTEPIEFPTGMDKIPLGYRTNLSDNLSDDHPLNLDFSTHPSGELTCGGCHPTIHGTMQMNNLECSSCHNPHSNTYGQFLKVDPINGGICSLCHDKTGWSQTSHNTSNATWNGVSPDPWLNTNWTTVNETACQNCHDPHGNASQYWLLKYSSEEDNCNVCHNGHVASTNIEGALSKSSTHPVINYQNIHATNEDPLTMDQHVECTDCHNPHQANQTGANPPDIPGSMTGTKGVDKDGNVIASILYEYEACYKCHQYSSISTQYYVPRYDEQSSIRQEFTTTNPSYHPVVAEGQNPNVPSLKSPYTVNSTIYCSDCHNSDDSESPSGTNGPHGSIYPPILKDQLILPNYNPESATIYALCYRCHDRNSILNDESGFPHYSHIVSRQISCSTCHDPHGSYNNTHLINFNTDYVGPSSGMGGGKLEFIDDGVFHGKCYLKCHGRSHSPKTY